MTDQETLDFDVQELQQAIIDQLKAPVSDEEDKAYFFPRDKCDGDPVRVADRHNVDCLIAARASRRTRAPKKPFRLLVTMRNGETFAVLLDAKASTLRKLCKLNLGPVTLAHTPAGIIELTVERR